MRAGKLSETITIERFITTVDEIGTPTDTWKKVARARAQVIQQSTEEFLRGAGQASDATMIFRVRHVEADSIVDGHYRRGPITLDDRVVFAGRPYDLKEIKTLGRRQGMDLRCTAAKV